MDLTQDVSYEQPPTDTDAVEAQVAHEQEVVADSVTDQVLDVQDQVDPEPGDVTDDLEAVAPPEASEAEAEDRTELEPDEAPQVLEVVAATEATTLEAGEQAEMEIADVVEAPEDGGTDSLDVESGDIAVEDMPSVASAEAALAVLKEQVQSASEPVADEPDTDASEADGALTGERDVEEPAEEDQADDSEESMGGYSVADWDYQEPKRGQIRDGIILSIGAQEIIVDVDAKRDGMVPFADMQRMGPDEIDKLSVGDDVKVYILRPEDQDGNLLVSLYQARQAKAWELAAKLADSGEVLEGEVIGYNKGGLVVPLQNIRGFVPASQIPGFPQNLSQEDRLQRLSEKVGETLQFKVIEFNRRNRRLILSSTAAQRDWRKEMRKRLLEGLREGEVRTGTVSSLCSFGAFVDLGGADGLVHLSELSWRRVRHPREVISVGEQVEVLILRLDMKRKRIGLSLKRLQPEPWALVEEKYELGQLVEGRVTNVVDFGAFAEIEEGVEGLIHVSELADAPISHPREVVKKGDLLLLRIIRVDIRRKRLGLSLKRVLESEWAEWAARLALAEAERAKAEEEAAAERAKAKEEAAAERAKAQEEAAALAPDEAVEDTAELASTAEESPESSAPELLEEDHPGDALQADTDTDAVASGEEQLAEAELEADPELAEGLDAEDIDLATDRDLAEEPRKELVDSANPVAEDSQAEAAEEEDSEQPDEGLAEQAEETPTAEEEDSEQPDEEIAEQLEETPAAEEEDSEQPDEEIAEQLEDPPAAEEEDSEQPDEGIAEQLEETPTAEEEDSEQPDEELAQQLEETAETGQEALAAQEEESESLSDELDEQLEIEDSKGTEAVQDASDMPVAEGAETVASASEVVGEVLEAADVVEDIAESPEDSDGTPEQDDAATNDS